MAILAVALALLVKLSSDHLIGEGPPLILFAAAVTVSAWYGGRGPGLLAIALSMLISCYLFFPPYGSLAILNPNDRFRMVFFVLEGVLTSQLMDSLHAARRRAEERTRERERAEKALRVAEERYRLLVEGVKDYAIFMLSPDGRIESWNSGAERITGYSEKEILGRHFSLLYDEEDVRRRHCESELEKAMGVGWFEEEGWRVRKDGTRFWTTSVITTLRDERGSLKGFAKITRDITESKRAREQLIYQGTHDALTGLPNRALLLQNIEEAIVSTAAQGNSFALLLLDLDRFKEINDTFGHHFGDAVLQRLRPILLGAVRQSDIVARLGGDEFGILLPVSDQGRAVWVAERIITGLRQPVIVEGQPLDVGVSIGIALYPEHGQDTSTLLQRADVAMYAAKRARAGQAVYTSDQANYTSRRLALAGELRQGIENNQLLLHYQPKIDLKTMRVRGAEALVRWLHPRDGLIPPGDFIPLAEHTGLIKPLGLWTLQTALLQCRAWHQAGMDLNVAVNLAPENLQDGPLLKTIEDLLASSDTLPGWLTVEVTESAMMADPARVRTILAHLHELGVRISIDDFGTGYSSLAYLKDLPVDEVKIDRSFVKDLADNEPNACIVRAVINLGHDLGLRVVAEGVEDEASLNLLATWRCDVVQGYLFSRPLAPADFMDWVSASSTSLSAFSPASHRLLNGPHAVGPAPTVLRGPEPTIMSPAAIWIT
ncbi:MAG: putative bifunctional diguanylate cyclase/phosphodiesterase [Candidatus Geothermincolia bacterium]